MANAILAAILSFFIPGLGQFYVGDSDKGIKFLIIAIILWIATFLFIFAVIISFIFSIYAAYDAYKLAQ